MKNVLLNNFRINGLNLVNFINLTDKEIEEVRRLRNHPAVRKWMYDSSVINKRDHARFILGLKESRSDYYWLANNGSGRYIGVIYLKRFSCKNKNAFLGIYVNMYKKFLGSGTQLMESIKKIAFTKAGLHTLKLEVLKNNVVAIRFYKKSGFCKEGEIKEFVFKDGKWIDVIIMGMKNR